MEKLSATPSIAPMIMEGECLSLLIEKSRNVADCFSEIQDQHDALMRRRALTVLANGLSSCKILPEELTKESFVRQLLQCLGNSSEEPHEACQAARCLQALTSANASMQSLLNTLHAESILSS